MAYQDSGMLELANPQLASILRQRRFAEQLMQSGVDASPIQHPLQGLSRLAQALLGGYEARSADSKMDDIGQKQDKDAADFMKAMQPQTTQAPLSGMPAAVAGQPTAMAPDLMQHFQVASARTGVPVPVLVAQAQQESNLNPDAVGKAGEVGVMQVHPRTARDPGFGLAPVDPATLRDPGRNIQFGADYLAARAKAQGVTDWNDPKQRAAGLTAYNGGGDPNYAQNVESRLPNAGGGPVVIGATSTVAPGADIEGQLAEAARLRGMARQGLMSQNPRMRALGENASREADAIERRAFEMSKRAEGTPARSPERFTQDMAVAAAGRPTVDQKVYGEGAGTGMKLAAERLAALQDRVIANKGLGADMEMFETAMKGFEPGAGADIRTAAERAKAFLGFDNAADQAGLMQNIQARLKLNLSQTLKGQGQISDRERELLSNAADLIGNDPRGARLIMRAIKGMHTYDDQVHEIYLKSAENNGGTPSPVEVGREIKKLGTPVDRSIIADLEKRAESQGKAGPGAAPRQPSSYQEGQTATGPGGARMIYRGGQWVPLQ